MPNDLDYTATYAFDSAGNRLVKRHDAGSDGSATPDTVTLYRYDANDRLLAEGPDDNVDGTLQDGERDSIYTYDAAGSLISVAGADQVVHTRYVYDAMGKMVGLDANANGLLTDPADATFRYDHAGTLVAKSVVGGVAEVYLQDDHNPTGYSQVLEQVTDSNADGVRGLGETVARAFALGGDVITQADASTLRHLLYDAGGHTRALLDAYGQIATDGIYAYDAYGIRLTGNPILTPLQYRGEWLDATLGQYVLRARLYDPQSGRFLSQDSYAGDRSSPSSLHKYQYCEGNPINATDPTGMWLLADILGSTGLRAFLPITVGGAIIGGALSAVDGLLQGHRGMQLVNDLFLGSAFGAAVAPLFLTPLAPLVAGFGIGAGIAGTWTAIDEENYELAAFRGVTTALGTYASYKTFVPVMQTGRVVQVSPKSVLFSQRTAGGKGADGLSRASIWRQYLRRFGFDGVEPIDAVQTPAGMSVIDNTRAAVALEQGMPWIPVRIHKPTDPLPPGMIANTRFGSAARTWGDALAFRTARNGLPATGTPTPPALPKP